MCIVLTTIAEVQEKATPQNSKSTTEKISEGVTNTADKASR